MQNFALKTATILTTSTASVESPLGRCFEKRNGGRGGIRTHGELAPTAVFKTAALNHSATLPLRLPCYGGARLARLFCPSVRKKIQPV